MSCLFYGAPGDPAQQAILYGVRIVEIDQRPVKDGPTYLYTHYRITVEGYYNPWLNSYNWFPNAGQPGQIGQLINTTASPLQNVAGVTNEALRQILMQPRGVLYIVTGNDLFGNANEIILSPQRIGDNPGFLYDTDATFGPNPVDCVVTHVSGIKTFKVYYTIETDLIESDRFCTTAALSPLISHRWTMNESIDQDFYSTITMRGHAVFRADRMNYLGSIFHVAGDPATPDDWRCLIIPATTYGYKRERLEIYPSEDGLSLEYVIIDRTHGYDFTSSAVNTYRVTRMEVETHIESHTEGLGINLGGGIVKGITKAVVGAEGFAAGAAIGGPVGFLAQLIMFGKRVGEGKMEEAARELAYFNIPKTFRSVVIRIWGDLYSFRIGLFQVSQVILTQLFTNFFNAQLFGTTNVSINEDLMGRFIQVTASIEMGPLGIAAANLFGGTGPFIIGEPGKWPSTVIQSPDWIPGVTTRDALLVGNPQAPQPPPGVVGISGQPPFELVPGEGAGTRTVPTRLVPQDPGAPCMRPLLPVEIAQRDNLVAIWPVFATDDMCPQPFGTVILSKTQLPDSAQLTGNSNIQVELKASVPPQNNPSPP